MPRTGLLILPSVRYRPRALRVLGTEPLGFGCFFRLRRPPLGALRPTPKDSGVAREVRQVQVLLQVLTVAALVTQILAGVQDIAQQRKKARSKDRTRKRH